MSDDLVPGLRFASRAQELWAAVIVSFGAWEERVNRAAAAASLSPVSAWALVQIDPEDPISQKELAARLRCSPSTVVDPTDRLEDAGLVDRQVDPADRRINVLVITPKGRTVRERLINELFEPPAAFRRLPASELARLRDVMLRAVAGPEPGSSERTTGRKPAVRR